MIRPRRVLLLDSSDAVATERPVTAAAVRRAPTRRGRRSAPWRRALAVAVGVGVALGAALSAAAPAAGQVPSGEPEARRMLLISVPGLTWEEVRDHDLPAI
jgi:hypothetical protein